MTVSPMVSVLIESYAPLIKEVDAAAESLKTNKPAWRRNMVLTAILLAHLVKE